MSEEVAPNRPVGFVGSMPLPSATAVFDAVASRVGALAPRIPDGETGPRLGWIGWQRNLLVGREGIEIVREMQIEGPASQVFRQLKLKDGYRVADLKLRPLGYLEPAIESYAEFCKAREAGKIQSGVRFQVSLPTPFALACGILGPVHEMLAAFEAAYQSELADICSAIPHEDLAIQWDVASETHGEEGRRHPEAFRSFAKVIQKGETTPQETIPPREELGFQESIEAAARACDWIPDDIQVGIHLCYGDPDGKHIIEPHDMSVMMEIANGLTAAVNRRIDWIHMPVPIERDDDAYFAPMKHLKIQPETTIFLGLLHLDDGVDGARRRIAAARKVLPHFGLATECGLGRRPPETIPALLDLHRVAAERL